MSTSASDPKPSDIVTGYPAPAPASVAGTPGSGGAAAAAYPYPAPPPHAAAPYYYQHQHQFSNAVQPPPPSYYPSSGASYSYSSSFFRRIFVFTVIFILLFGLAMLIFWIVLRPRIPEVSLSSASLSAFNLTSSTYLSADFNLALTFHNPNSKMGVYYDRLVAAALYDGENLANAALPPFYQPTGNTTDVNARLVAASAYVSSDAARGIEAESSRGDGAVRFHFRVVAWVQFHSGAWRTRWHVMRVSCDNVLIGTQNATANVEINRSVPRQCVVII